MVKERPGVKLTYSIREKMLFYLNHLHKSPWTFLIEQNAQRIQLGQETALLDAVQASRESWQTHYGWYSQLSLFCGPRLGLSSYHKSGIYCWLQGIRNKSVADYKNPLSSLNKSQSSINAVKNGIAVWWCGSEKIKFTTNRVRWFKFNLKIKCFICIWIKLYVHKIQSHVLQCKVKA